MIKYVSILIILISLSFESLAQDSTLTTKPNFAFKGQFSSWGHFNQENPYPLYLGGRYIPQLNTDFKVKKDHLIDFELSTNLVGNMGFQSFDSTDFDGDLDPYRAWGRYSNDQFEFRVGLQKIDFGTAVILRSLRWFDQLDPRDPLNLTEGVWGGLIRYYFLNNANLWIWSLYGNQNQKGSEVFKTTKQTPEFGGRFQFPIPLGESGISYHHRKVDTRGLSPIFTDSKVQENRLGIDIKLDYVVGLWIEGAWIHKNSNVSLFTNQEFITIGSDYTFGVGNGLNITAEHMLFSSDEKAFKFSQTTNFTGFSANYPIGMFNNLQTIIYYDWKSKSAYNFVNWYMNFDHTTFYVMLYWNPDQSNMPTQNTSALYGGKGIQLMFVFNH